MGILIRLLLITGIVWMTWQYVGDKVGEKFEEIQARTYEFVNPEKTRADLLSDLDVKIAEMGRTGETLERIDLDKIEDPETKKILAEAKEKISEQTVNEITKIIDKIEELNEKDNPVNEAISKMIEKAIDSKTENKENAAPTPSANIMETITKIVEKIIYKEAEPSVTPTPTANLPTPSVAPPAPQCKWVCE